jgi:hypothetical protein
MDASKYEYMLNLQALPTQLDQLSSGNMLVNDHQRIADNYGPAHSPGSETPLQFS